MLNYAKLKLEHVTKTLSYPLAHGRKKMAANLTHFAAVQSEASMIFTSLLSG